MQLLQATAGTGRLSHDNSLSPHASERTFAFALLLSVRIIVLGLRWHLRFALSYRDVGELLAELGIEIDHVTVYWWVQRFTPLLAEAARPCRHAVGNR